MPHAPQYVAPTGVARMILLDLAIALPSNDMQLWQEAHHFPHREFAPLEPGFKSHVLESVGNLSPSQVFALCEAADGQGELGTTNAFVQSALSVLGLGLRNDTLVSQLRDRASTAVLILLANYQAEENKKALGLIG